MIDEVQCGNHEHPYGRWHHADPIAASWEWKLMFRQWLNKRKWGCICKA